MHHILVYTDGEVIGDGILRLSFADALKRALPEVHLTWLVRGHSVYNNVLREMAAPLIDQVVLLPGQKVNPRDYLFRPAVLRGQKFDLIIDTQRKVKHTLWLKRIRHRHFLSATADGVFASFKLPSLSPHFLQRLMQLGEIGIKLPLISKPLALPPGDWDQKAASLLPDGPRYIGFVVGAGHPLKCWPFERFMALAAHVTAQGYTPVIFLGPKEQEHYQTITATLPNAIMPLNAGVEPSPYLTIALGKRLTAAVANDSGGGHLLAAGGSPLVSIIRSSTVRTKFMPCTDPVIALAPEDFNGDKMDDIPLEAVTDALQKILNESA